MKIKIVSLMITILIIVMYVPVYAETSFPAIPSDTWEYWVIVEDSFSGTRIVASHSPITVTNGILRLNLEDGKQMYELTSDNTWRKMYEQEGPEETYFSTMHASNHDIAYDDGSGFFFLRPRVLRLIRAVQTMDFGTILRNFSAGLIPIIGLWILIIAFRKAWAFLRSQLQS